MATLPNFVAGTELKTPLKLPIGVRTALTMTAFNDGFTRSAPSDRLQDSVSPLP